MENKSVGQTERTIAQSIQTQFNFYIVSLTFTLLAASVQTAKFGHSNFEDLTEIIAWFLFTISGLVRLSHIEWEPLIRGQIAYQNDIDARVTQVKTARLQGVRQIHVLEDDSKQSIEAQLDNLAQSRATLDAIIKKNEKVSFKKYDVAKYSFVVGLTLLVISRASSAIAAIFGYSLL